MNRLLIVVDMQNDFVDGALGTQEAKEIVANVLAKVRGFDGTVIYTRDTHEADYLTTQEGTLLPVEHCIRGSAGWNLIGPLAGMAEADGSKVFDKVTFGSKELIAYLVELDKKDPIGRIELIGLCTDICVISNALAIKAWLPEVPIVVDAACCAGVTPETHENALRAMSVCQVEILNSPEDC